MLCEIPSDYRGGKKQLSERQIKPLPPKKERGGIRKERGSRERERACTKETIS
jgi:hypothetical protein